MEIYLPIAEMPVNIWFMIGLGAAVGFLSGMFGVGGGFILTPFLMFLGIPPAVAVATQSTQIVASSVSGVLTHFRQGTVDFKMGGVLLVGGFIGSIAGIILSAGASRRMGTAKALLRLNGETFLDGLIGLFSEVASPVVVVLGHQAEQIRSGVERGAAARFVVNPDPERGMLSSLQCGLEAVPPGAEAAMFTPVDHPNIEKATLEMLIGRFEAERAPVTIPMYRGEHGHPVLIARPLIAELLSLATSAQASDVIHRYRTGTSYVEVNDSAVTTDIDDRAAYAELVARHP